MRLSFPALILTAVCGIVLLGFSPSSGEPEQAERFRQSKDWKGCGVEKLSHEEFKNLLTLSGSYSNRSYLDQSILQYMLKQGWKRTDVLGYFQKEDNPTSKELIAMSREGHTYLIEPPLSVERLDPGVYWTKGNSSTWEVLREDGNTENSYWIRETW